MNIYKTDFILSGKNMINIFLRLGTRQECPIFLLLVNIDGVLARVCYARKINKRHTNRKE